MSIVDILGNEWDCKCVGCGIGNSEIIPPGGIILGTRNFVLHQDPQIPIKGFLIITAKKHIRSISELTYDEAQELFDLVYKARIAQKSIKDIKQVSIIQEERSGHLHLWLLPRYKWMNEIFENSLKSIRDIMNYAREKFSNESDTKAIVNAVKQIRKVIET